MRGQHGGLAPALARRAGQLDRPARLAVAALPAQAAVGPEADLSRLEPRLLVLGAVLEFQRALGHIALQRGRPARRAHRDGCLPEPVRFPALRLRALDPGHHRDALLLQLVEQARAPALAIEDQRQARLPARPLQQPQLLQLGHDPVPDLARHARVHLAVQAQQRRPAQRVHPVAGRRRQGQLLARHEVPGQPALAAVDLHVAIHEQRGDRLRVVRAPVPGQAPDPRLQPLRFRQQARPPAQGARAGAAVQAQQGPPLPGLLVAQALGAAHPAQQQEGPQQQQRGQPVEPLGQLQLADMAQQARRQQCRHGRQHAAARHGRGGREARLAAVERAQAGSHAALRVVGGDAHAGLRVALVALFPSRGLRAPGRGSAAGLAGRRGGHWLAGSRPSRV